MVQLHHGSIDGTSEFGEWTEFVAGMTDDCDEGGGAEMLQSMPNGTRRLEDRRSLTRQFVDNGTFSAAKSSKTIIVKTMQMMVVERLSKSIDGQLRQSRT